MASSPDFTLRFELESRLRFIKYAEQQDPEETPNAIDVWVHGFRAGVAARTHPRTVERLTELLTAAGADVGRALEGTGY